MKLYAFGQYSNYEFYHWFYYALATLFRIKDISGTVYFTGPMNDLEFQESSLKYLKHTYIYVKEVPPEVSETIYLEQIHHTDRNTLVEKEAYHFLRENFYFKNTFEGYKPMSRLLYISRNKAVRQSRLVLNELEVYTELEKRGFEIIYLEDLPLDEKIKTFYEAKMIITPAGGAMALGIFMNPKAKMVEITGETMPLVWDGCYPEIFKELGISFLQYLYTDMSGAYNLTIKDLNNFIGTIDNELATIPSS